MKEARITKIQNAWFHVLYKILENANQSIVTEADQLLPGDWGGSAGRGREVVQGDMGKLLEIVDLFIILIVLMVS